MEALFRLWCVQRPKGKTAWKIQEWNDRGYSCPKESSRREFTLCGYLPSPLKYLRLLYLCVEIRGQPWGHFSGSSACYVWRHRFSMGPDSLAGQQAPGKLPVSLFPALGLKCSSPCISVYMDAGDLNQSSC